MLHIIQLFVYNSSKEFVRHVPSDKIFTIKSEKAVRIGLQTMSSSEHERMRYKRTERCKIYRSHVYHRIVSIKGVSLHIKCQYVVCGCIEMYSYGSDLLSSDGCDFGAHTMCKICTVINFSQFKSTLFFKCDTHRDSVAHVKWNDAVCSTLITNVTKRELYTETQSSLNGVTLDLQQ